MTLLQPLISLKNDIEKDRPIQTNNVKTKDPKKICSKYVLRSMCNIYRESIIVVFNLFMPNRHS